MAKIPLTLKISKEAHAALKAGQGTIGARVDSIFLNSDFDDVANALRRRYESGDVPAERNSYTKVLITHQANQKLDLLSLKTGLSRDLLINLFMENFLVKNRVNQLHTTKLLN